MRCMARRITRSSSRSPFTTVCSLYYSADGGELLILPLVNGFHDGLHAVLLSGWQQIVHNSPRQRLSPRLRAILLPDGTVLLILPLVVRFHEGCALYCSADGTVLLILPLVNGVPDISRAVLHSGWKRIARSAVCRRLSRFARCIAQRRAADCSFFHSSTAFMTVCTLYRSFFRSSTTFSMFRVLYHSAHGSALLVLPLANGFHGLRVVLLSGWRRISHPSIRQRLSRRFARSIAQWLAADFSYFSSSMAFTTAARHIAPWMAPCCSFFLSSTAFMVCAPYCSEDGSRLCILQSSTAFPKLFSAYCLADGSVLLIRSLMNSFHDGLRTVLLSQWQYIAHSFTPGRIFR